MSMVLQTMTIMKVNHEFGTTWENHILKYGSTVEDIVHGFWGYESLKGPETGPEQMKTLIKKLSFWLFHMRQSSGLTYRDQKEYDATYFNHNLSNICIRIC